MSKAYFSLPRIYTDQNLTPGTHVLLTPDQVHYFRSVMRRQAGDELRLFNGRDGEFIGRIEELAKKSGTVLIDQCIRPQPTHAKMVHMIFAPIKKHRMDFLIEKAVELGVTDFHPVLSHRTEVRKINEERVQAQIKEAAEQCERMSLPCLHPLEKLDKKLSSWANLVPVQWCYERSEDEPFDILDGDEVAFLIGPEGGFSEDEVHWLEGHKCAKPCSLGEVVYRVETAAILFLAKLL